MKISEKIISILLAAIMVTGLFAFNASMTGGEYAQGDIIEFGSYPQSEVTDAETVARLEIMIRH